ncbi:MAG: hypothetical protein HYS53_02640 [Candidatus Aenigmarchaeota archaeon]|nr:hypothetical protein [Candidatus Aenigmarchaeota archaeon]
MVAGANDYQAAINAIESGRAIISTGKVDGKRVEPVRVLTAAADQFRRAETTFDSYRKAVSAEPVEAARYARLEDAVKNLKQEIRGYARKVVEGVVKDVDSRVGSLKATINKERTRYEARFGMMPRVSATAVKKDMDNARQTVADQTRYVARIRDELRNQGLYDRAADDSFFIEARDSFDTASSHIDVEEARHRQNVDNADIRKTNKEWEREQKKHTKAIKKRKFY